ncbi:MAG: hypothetical protein QOH08_1156, partial [Chloroflexota bacterium]|nr:hypothetical protein [Chloroflexota bacterium]
MAQPRGRKVLVVAADGATRMALQRGLGDDVTVTGASDVAQAVRFVVADEPDVIVLDLTLDPGGYGSG